MMITGEELAESLNAALDEDEWIARASGESRIAWLTYLGDQDQMLYTTVADGRDGVWVADGKDLPTPSRVLIVYETSRALREVQAKRRLFRAHSQPHECISLTGSGDHSVVDGKPWELWEPAHTDDHGPCLVLRCLASVYGIHLESGDADG